MALKLRRAEERFIPQSTRAVSFKRLLGSLGTRSPPRVDTRRYKSSHREIKANAKRGEEAGHEFRCLRAEMPPYVPAYVRAPPDGQPYQRSRHPEPGKR